MLRQLPTCRQSSYLCLLRGEVVLGLDRTAAHLFTCSRQFDSCPLSEALGPDPRELVRGTRELGTGDSQVPGGVEHHTSKNRPLTDGRTDGPEPGSKADTPESSVDPGLAAPTP